jgi:hypothetical protein
METVTDEAMTVVEVEFTPPPHPAKQTGNKQTMPLRTKLRLAAMDFQ